MKTDLELKRILADELPTLIHVRQHPQITAPTFWWDDTYNTPDPRTVSDREWLWVVAECEKKLNAAQKIQYTELSASECQLVDWGYYADEAAIDWDEVSILVFLTWQQRAVAYFKAIGKISIIP